MQHSKFSLMVGACVLGLAVTAHAEDNAAQAAARAAVLAQMGQTNASTPSPAVPAPKLPASYQWQSPQPAPAPVVVAPIVAPPLAPVVTTTNSDNAAQAAARAALAQHPVLATPAPAATPVAPVIVAKPVTASPAPVIVPVVPTPLPITKEGKLQALNAQYKAGQITPLDYFNQREAILSGN